jgi:hypothetical protein
MWNALAHGGDTNGLQKRRTNEHHVWAVKQGRLHFGMSRRGWHGKRGKRGRRGKRHSVFCLLL